MPTTHNFVLGIIAGEGSFSSSVSIDESRKLNVQAQLQFNCGMEDADLVYLLQETAGFGKVYELSNGITTWKCENYDDREKLIQYIHTHADEGFTTSLKWQQFLRWEKANDYYHAHIYNKHRTKEEMKTFVKMCKDVNKYRGYAGKEYSLENVLAAIDRGSAETYTCGYERTISGKPCGQLVTEADTHCYNHQ